MTRDEFLSSIKSNGATFAPPSPDNLLSLTTSALQNLRAAMLPEFIIELYKITGGIVLGDGYIFGPAENKTMHKYPVPTIVQINTEIAHVESMRGKTVFGRNDLFWFAFDAFGTCYMLDNLTLRPVRKYDDPWRALTDCLIVGKL
ncbi:hypothetical protein LJC18_04175 [Lachnospiraceae bacterium OttesenSCG-928-E19]|nr:hypothetical protein [Lachnospiraceae bacterium OttesenSCG-928-E19]